MYYICTRKQVHRMLVQAVNLKQYGTGLWCNGNTTDFGSVILGSSPSRPTKTSHENERFFVLYLYILIE